MRSINANADADTNANDGVYQCFQVVMLLESLCCSRSRWCWCAMMGVCLGFVLLLLLGLAMLLFARGVACVRDGLVFVVLRTGWVDFVMLLPMVTAIFAASSMFPLALVLFVFFYQRRYVESRFAPVQRRVGRVWGMELLPKARQIAVLMTLEIMVMAVEA